MNLAAELRQIVHHVWVSSWVEKIAVFRRFPFCSFTFGRASAMLFSLALLSCLVDNKN